MFNYPIHNITFGKGKSYVLFLHGWGGSTNSFLSVAKRLENTHKIILVDFYGFGKTKYPDKVLDAYEYALELYNFLKNKNITKLSIVAHSFGGRIAIILASMFDLEIEKLVLVGGAGVLPRRTLTYKLKVFKYKIYKNLAKRNLLDKEKLSKFGSDEYKKLDDLQKLSYVKIVNQDLTYLLSNIKCSTLLVWGTRDKSTPMYMAKIMQKKIKNCGAYYYMDSGHFAYLENYNNFCNLLSTYLKGN